MSTEKPRMEIQEEKRFAVVMYGGVSLAIYINGVAQEMFRMVRATAPDAVDGERALLGPDELRGTESVYRKIAQLPESGGETEPRPDDPLRRRFVVDILSGTSAGGINAVFLAKALANDQELSPLQDLWIEEGDLARLINDRASNLDGMTPQRPPKSLLNSRRMYRKLREALGGMEAGRPSAAGRSSPLVDELDLFVTATDVNGQQIFLRLADRLVSERKHRQVFRFRYRGQASGEPRRNDFLAQNDPFLAFAARSTSAFPFAFEPMRLADIDVERRESWEEFYVGQANGSFAARPFGDGGYLDNKPFGHAIDALTQHTAAVSVDRKLIYVEPSPELARAPVGEPRSPNALENTVAALTLARYETIREDVQRILERNRLIERVERILSGMEHDVAESGDRLDFMDWADAGLGKMIEEEGVAYGGYLRLRVGVLTDELAALILRHGFDPLSDESVAIRHLVREWRDQRYSYYAEEDKESFHKFLSRFDLAFYIRRLQFVRQKIKQLLPLDEATAAAMLGHCGVDWRPAAASAREIEAFKAGLVAANAELSPKLRQVKAIRERLRRYERGSELDQLIAGIDLRRAELKELLEKPREEERRIAARSILERVEEQIDALARHLATEVGPAHGIARDCKMTLGYRVDEDGERELPTEPPADPAELARWVVGRYFREYLRYDLISYPILYVTGVGEERDKVEVIRISPLDATSLIDEEHGSRRKLAGTVLANFGAFLERKWRENDILWGRLDGAERIITALLPEDDQAARREGLIREAHEAILEEFAAREGQKVGRHLVDALMARQRDLEEGQVSTPFATANESSSRLEATLRNALAASLDPRKLHSLFAQSYEVDRELDREQAVRSLARSTQVVGEVLENISDEKGVDSGAAAWLTRLGRLFWGLVEVSVPRGMANLFYRHGRKLLLLFAVLMVVGGWVSGQREAQSLGYWVLAIVLAVNAASWLLSDWLRGRRLFLRILTALLGAVLLAIFLLGVAHLPEFVEQIAMGLPEWLRGLF